MAPKSLWWPPRHDHNTAFNHSVRPFLPCNFWGDRAEVTWCVRPVRSRRHVTKDTGNLSGFRDLAAIAHGIRPDRIALVSYGEARPECHTP